jgi:hypothetical protein
MEGEGWIGLDEWNVLTSLYLSYMGWFYERKNVFERASDRAFCFETKVFWERSVGILGVWMYEWMCNNRY